MSDSLKNFVKYTSRKFYCKPDATSCKNKVFRIKMPCESCKELSSFFMEENPKLCSSCSIEFDIFHMWETKHGKFRGWKSVKEWEQRYNV